MSSEYSENGTEGEIFVREFDFRLFVVLRYGDKEAIEALPIGVREWDEAQTRRHITKVVHRLMERTGVQKLTVKEETQIDESLH